MTEQRRDLIAAGVEKQILGAPVNITIALNPSLRIQQEAVISLVLNQRLHSIRHHAIEPPHSVIAGDPDLCRASPDRRRLPPVSRAAISRAGSSTRERRSGAGKNAQLARAERETQRCRENLVLAGAGTIGSAIVGGRRHNKIIALRESVCLRREDGRRRDGVRSRQLILMYETRS